MAFLGSWVSFNQDDQDFYDLVTNFTVDGLVDDLDTTLSSIKNGVTVEHYVKDSFFTQYQIDGVTYSTAFMSESDISYDGADRDSLAGTINVIGTISLNGNTSVHGISGINVDFGDLIEAMITPTSLDDQLLINEMLTGNDTFNLSDENDLARGFDGSDKMRGHLGNDKLYGGNNNDKLYGGKGNDLLKGDAGRDILQGNTGKDTMFGGSGADTFAFVNTSESKAKAKKADIIKDFQQDTDVIDLSAIDASTELGGNDAFSFNGTTAFSTESEGEIRYKQFDKAGAKKDYTRVVIDTDSDRGAEMSIKLMGLHSLTEDDFIL